MIDQSVFKELKQNNIAVNPEKVKLRIRELWKQNMHKRDEILELAGIKKITVERTYKNGNISAKLAGAMGQILNINPNFLTGNIDEPGVCSDDILVAFLKAEGYEKMFEKPVKKKRQYKNVKPVSQENDSVASDEPVEEDKEAIDEPLEEVIKKLEDVVEDEEEIEEEPEEVIEEVLEEEPEEVIEKVIEEEPEEAVEKADKNEQKVTKIIEKIEPTTESKREYLDALTEDDINLLLKGLILRSKYLEDAKVILDLVKSLLLG